MTEEELDNKRQEDNDNNPNNELKNFQDNYGKEFLTLISIPLVSVCKAHDFMVPYEYSDRVIRHRRSMEEINNAISDDGIFPLIVYCFNRRIDKKILTNIVAGNLYGYYSMKQNYGNRGQ